MVLIDTNIWIEFLKGNQDYSEEVVSLLQNRLVVTIEPVFSELLYGVRDKKDEDKINEYWKILPKLEFNQESLIEASKFANEHKFFSKGIGLFDAVIIKAAIENSILIWTLDKKMLRRLEDKQIFKTP